MQEAPPSVDRRRADAESLAWIEALSGAGRRHDEAVEALHASSAIWRRRRPMTR
jgi:hypothetical protein